MDVVKTWEPSRSSLSTTLHASRSRLSNPLSDLQGPPRHRGSSSTASVLCGSVVVPGGVGGPPGSSIAAAASAASAAAAAAVDDPSEKAAAAAFEAAEHASQRRRNITRNFAIDLLQHLEMSPETMAGLFADKARSLRGREGLRGEAHLTPDELPEFLEELVVAQNAVFFEGQQDNVLSRESRARERESLLHNLREKVRGLYRAVDINETGALRWEALMWFLIQAAMKGRIGGSPDIHLYHPSRKHGVVPRSEPKLQRIEYAPALKRLFVSVEEGIRITDPANPLDPAADFVPVGGSGILCSVYVPFYKAIAASCADLTVRVVDVKLKKCRAVAPCDESQLCIVWSEGRRHLLTASRSGQISVWALRLFREGGRGVTEDTSLGDNPSVMVRLQQIQRWDCHRSPVQAMLVLPSQRIVSASLDPALYIQEPAHGEIVVTCTGATAGLLALGHSSYSGIVLSGGFQKELMAWPVTSGRHTPLLLQDKLCPHAAPIIGIHAVDGSPEVISCEQSGAVKVWDLRTLQCVQTLTRSSYALPAVEQAMLFSSMTYVPPDQKIYVSAPRRVIGMGISAGVTGSSVTVDTQSNTAACYAVDSQMLVTAAGARVRFWQVSTGELCTAHSGLVPEKEQISALAIDNTGCVLFAGTQKGYVRSFTLANGTFICKYLACPGQEVRFLTVVMVTEGLRYLIGAGWGGKVFVFSVCGTSTVMARMTNTSFRRDLAGGRMVAYDPVSSLFLIGGRAQFSLWKVSKSPRHGLFASLRIGAANCANTSSVGCVRFVDDEPVVAIGVGRNVVQLWSVPSKTSEDEHVRLRLLLQWETPTSRPLCALSYLPTERLLSCGDDKGTLVTYAVGPVLDLARLSYASSESPAEAAAAADSPPVSTKDSPRMAAAARKVRLGVAVANVLGSQAEAGKGGALVQAIPPGSVAMSPVAVREGAHVEGCIGLMSLTDPHKIIVSSGYDRCVRIWSPILVPLGCLNPYVAGGGYSIKEDTLSQKELEMLRAHERAMVAPPSPTPASSTFLTELPAVEARCLPKPSASGLSVNAAALPPASPAARGEGDADTPSVKLRVPVPETPTALAALPEHVRQLLSALDQEEGGWSSASPPPQSPVKKTTRLRQRLRAKVRASALLGGKKEKRRSSARAAVGEAGGCGGGGGGGGGDGGSENDPSAQWAQETGESGDTHKDISFNKGVWGRQFNKDAKLLASVRKNTEEPEAVVYETTAAGEVVAKRREKAADLHKLRRFVRESNDAHLKIVRTGLTAGARIAIGTTLSQRTVETATETRALDRSDHRLRGYVMTSKQSKLEELERYASEGMDLYDILLTACRAQIKKNDTILSRTLRHDRVTREKRRRRAEAHRHFRIANRHVTEALRKNEHLDFATLWDHLKRSLAAEAFQGRVGGGGGGGNGGSPSGSDAYSSDAGSDDAASPGRSASPRDTRTSPTAAAAATATAAAAAGNPSAMFRSPPPPPLESPGLAEFGGDVYNCTFQQLRASRSPRSTVRPMTSDDRAVLHAVMEERPRGEAPAAAPATTSAGKVRHDLLRPLSQQERQRRVKVSEQRGRGLMLALANAPPGDLGVAGGLRRARAAR